MTAIELLKSISDNPEDSAYWLGTINHYLRNPHLLERPTHPVSANQPDGGEVPTIFDAIAKIDSLIKPGELQGNGCDETAQRNGLILAANALHGLLSAAPVDSVERKS